MARMIIILLVLSAFVANCCAISKNIGLKPQINGIGSNISRRLLISAMDKIVDVLYKAIAEAKPHNRRVAAVFEYYLRNTQIVRDFLEQDHSFKLDVLVPQLIGRTEIGVEVVETLLKETGVMDLKVLGSAARMVITGLKTYIANLDAIYINSAKTFI